MIIVLDGTKVKWYYSCVSETEVKRGRPRCFEKDEKLEAAAEVFLRHGYENASLDDLTEALGINKPSLYNTFGNKEEFFLVGFEQVSQTLPTVLRRTRFKRTSSKGDG